MSTLYMFPPNDTPPEDADLVAGEYVLGVMDPGEAAATRLRADTDPALRSAIGAWQARLVPLAAMLAPVTPPPTLWTLLAAELGIREPASPPAPAPIATEAEAEPPVFEIPVAELPIEAPVPFEPAPLTPEPLAPPAVEPEPVATAKPDFVAPSPEPQAPMIEPISSVPVEEVEPTAPYQHPHPMPLPLPSAEFYAPLPSIQPADAAPAVMPEPVPAASHFLAFEPDVPQAFASLRPLRLIDRIEVWRAATAACLALAIALGAVSLFSRAAPEKAVAAIGVVNAPAPLYLAEADADGHLRVTPLAIIAVPNGRDLQLWVIPPDATDPVSLGILPPGGQSFQLGGKPVEGTRFVVTMEPRGGSPSGRITGQVLYGGTLANR